MIHVRAEQKEAVGSNLDPWVILSGYGLAARAGSEQTGGGQMRLGFVSKMKR